MKGRTICPKCHHGFTIDVPQKQKCNVTCPTCHYNFIIRPPTSDSDKMDGCFWEHHGEPRKTILSSIKPKTDKPTLAAIILLCVFVIGIGSAIFSDIFISAPLALLSDVGITGEAEISVMNQEENILKNVTITFTSNLTIIEKNNSYYIQQMPLGIQQITISVLNYTTLNKEILVLPLIVSSHTIILEGGNNTDATSTFESLSCSLILLIFSLFALMSAISSLRRKHFDVAAIGSILAIFSFGFIFIGSLLSIIAFFILLKARDEFEDGKKGKVF